MNGGRARVPRPATAAGRGTEKGTLRHDLLAGFINAVVSVPDGLASAALTGVNPVYGLYTSVAAPIGASVLVSAQLMQVSTTSASALAAGQAIAGYSTAERDAALFLLVILAGLFLLLFGLLRLVRLVRFVSHAVMTGFLIGVAIVLILDQLAPLLGVDPDGANAVMQFVDLLTMLNEVSIPTLVTGLFAIALSVGLARTRLTPIASIAALVLPTLLVAFAGWRDVALVGDVSAIPRGIPLPVLPDPGLLTPELLLSAFSLAVIIAVQGAGVSQSVENPDGRRVSASRDLVAQGVGNVLSGLLRGIPAGGSVGQTALNVSVGARSRWAGVIGGLWMILFLLLLVDIVSLVPMAVLAALMILAGLGAIDLAEAYSIWNTRNAARSAILLTLVATLLLPVQVAVALGVVLTSALYIISSASDVTVKELIPLEDGRFAEAAPPERLSSDKVTVLDVYGSIFFAGARTLGEVLPDPRGATRPVVVLRLRGRTSVGATFIETLDEYADDLQEVGGRLYLSGVSEELARQLKRSGKLDLGETVRLFPAGDVVGEATGHALESASAWLGGGENR